MKIPYIILASNSPRRRELLSLSGFDFEVLVPDIKEVIDSEDPIETVLSLSEQKALACVKALKEKGSFKASKDTIVLGADTIVMLDDPYVKGSPVLGKPKSKEEARQMLMSLSNKAHLVYTGVTLADPISEKTKSFYEETRVYVAKLDDREIDEYIESGQPFDKAGGYGIQTFFCRYISKIEGDYNNVMGLPIARIYRELKDI